MTKMNEIIAGSAVSALIACNAYLYIKLDELTENFYLDVGNILIENTELKLEVDHLKERIEDLENKENNDVR